MQPAEARLALAAFMVTAAVVVGSILYIVVSFLVMRPHAPSRPWRRTLRAMLDEVRAIALTQPLLPFFYVFGRRMGGARDGRPVIFIHGYFQNRVDFLALAAALRRAGLGPLYGFNYDWTRSIPVCAARLSRFVDGVCRETGKEHVALVAHSLGGVIALEYLATPAGTAHVATCVTIASPHAGVLWRAGMIGSSARQLYAGSGYMQSRGTGPLGIPVVSIFSTHDNIVHPSSTSALVARGGADLPVDGHGHLGLLFSRDVADLTVGALRAEPRTIV